MSLLDQFEAQFNELSHGAIDDGELTELQPVELAGIVNQEITRFQNELSPSEKVESISILLSPHDYKRISKFENLLIDCDTKSLSLFKNLEKSLNFTLTLFLTNLK